MPTPKHSRFRERYPTLHAAGAQLLGWLVFTLLYWIADPLAHTALGHGAPVSSIWPGTPAEWTHRLIVALCALAAVIAFSIVSIRRERRYAEMQARLRRAYTAWDMSYQHIALLDAEGRVLEANHAGAELAEANPEAIRGRFFWECPGWEDPVESARMREACHRAKAGESDAFVTRFPKGALIRLMDTRVRPLGNSDGRIEYILVEAHDITEHKGLEQERETTALMLQMVLDTTPLRVFWKDREDRYLGCNRAFARDIGLAPEEIVGKRDADIFPPEIAAQIVGSDHAVIESRKPVVGREEHFHPGGLPERWIRTTVVPLVDGNGSVTGVLGSYEDITQQHQVREELERSRAHAETVNAELEMRVRERTSDLVQLNRELETFAHSAAHDLRTPLRAIDGWTHAVIEECSHCIHPEARIRLERVRSAAQRIGETLDDLLRLSQVSRSGFSPQDIDLGRLVRTQRDMFAAMHPERRFEWIIPESIPLRGDPELLRLMLWNLLDNAVKFTSRCDLARIEVGVDERGLFVRDNGVGFDMAHSGKLFNAFQRLHLPEEFSGTGVGLAVVRRIAERHDGHMEAEGAPGTGATFRFVPPRGG